MKKIEIPELTKQVEVFDINNYKTNVSESNRKRIINYGKSILEQESQNPGYITRQYFQDGYFVIVRKFYGNGNIKQKGILFNNGDVVNFIYEFDEEGNLVKEVDTDLGYDFGWREVIDYCLRHGARLEKGYPTRGGIKTEIYKRENEGRKVWEISYYDYERQKYLQTILDGKTGKEVKTVEIEFEGS